MELGPSDARLRPGDGSPARRIRIRRAAPGETITTLDGVTRTLDADMLVIADAARAQAVAGVMGGAHVRGLGDDADAWCSRAPASSPRRSAGPASASGLKTEASSRFERGADVNAPVVGARARARAHGADRRRTPRRRRSSTAIRRRAARDDRTRGADALRQLLGLQVPDAERRAHSARRSACTRRPDGRRLVRRGPDVPRGSRCARSTSSRRSDAITASTSSSRPSPR